MQHLNSGQSETIPLCDLEDMVYYSPSTMSQENSTPWAQDHLRKIASSYPPRSCYICVLFPAQPKSVYKTNIDFQHLGNSENYFPSVILRYFYLSNSENYFPSSSDLKTIYYLVLQSQDHFWEIRSYYCPHEQLILV